MATATAVSFIDVCKLGLDASHKALELYNGMLDQLIPWKTFNETAENLRKYQKDYSTTAGKLVGEITTLMLNSHDKYFTSTRLVYEWCSLVVPLLTGYLKLFENYNKEKAEGQKKILLKVLDEGIKTMVDAQKNLEESMGSFNGMTGKLSELNTTLNNDFNEKSAYFQGQVSTIRAQAYGGAAAGVAFFGPIGLVISYSIAAGIVEGKLVPELWAKLDEVKGVFVKLEATIKNADKSILTTKLKLKKEIKIIGEMKTQAQETKVWVEADDQSLVEMLKVSANKLIEMCKEYKTRHGKK